MAKPRKKNDEVLDSKAPIPSDYESVLQVVKGLIQEAQLRAVKAVNQALILTYREIGATIYR